MVIEQEQTQKKIRLCLCKPLRKSYPLLYCLCLCRQWGPDGSGVQTHALIQNLVAKFSIFNLNFKFSSHLKFCCVLGLLDYFVTYKKTFTVYKISNK